MHRLLFIATLFLAISANSATVFALRRHFPHPDPIPSEIVAMRDGYPQIVLTLPESMMLVAFDAKGRRMFMEATESGDNRLWTANLRDGGVRALAFPDTRGISFVFDPARDRLLASGPIDGVEKVVTLDPSTGIASPFLTLASPARILALDSSRQQLVVALGNPAVLAGIELDTGSVHPTDVAVYPYAGAVVDSASGEWVVIDGPYLWSMVRGYDPATGTTRTIADSLILAPSPSAAFDAATRELYVTQWVEWGIASYACIDVRSGTIRKGNYIPGEHYDFAIAPDAKRRAVQ